MKRISIASVNEALMRAGFKHHRCTQDARVNFVIVRPATNIGRSALGNYARELERVGFDVKRVRSDYSSDAKSHARVIYLEVREKREQQSTLARELRP